MNPRHFYIDSLARLRRVLAELGKYQPSAERPIEIVIGPWHRRPTADQYRAYWALLRDVSEQVWLEVPEQGRVRRFDAVLWHERFKLKFLGGRELPGGGFAPASTGSLSPKEFSDYITRVEADAVQEQGVLISDRRPRDGDSTDGSGQG